MINALMESMRAAANNDQEFNKAGMPAIAKLKLLTSVKVELSKYLFLLKKRTLWFPQILEANVLECVKFWLEPLGDGSLPSLDIQKAMFDTLTQVFHHFY
jgi:transcription factor SPN1